MLKLVRKIKKKHDGEPRGFVPRLGFHIKRKWKKFAKTFIDKNPYLLLDAQSDSAWKSFFRYVFREYIAEVSPKKSVSEKQDSNPETTSMQLASYRKNAKQIMSFSGSASFTQSFPKKPGLGGEVGNFGNIEPLNAWLFENATVFPCSSAIVASQQINVPSLYINHPDAIISDGRFLLEQSLNGTGTLNFPEPEHQKTGIMLFGSGAENWYHWLIEILPAGFLSQKLPAEFSNYPLVIPEDIYQFSTFRESLDLFKLGREVKFLSKGTHRFDRLIVIESPVIEPMNMRPGCWPAPANYSYNPEILLSYRNSILESFGVEESLGDERIFLARRHGRRSYNQDEILNIAKRYGFQDVYLEEMSFKEQVALLNKSAFVLGPSGAAFANTLFCNKESRLLSWLLPEYRGFCSYANISATVGSKLRYIYGASKVPISSTLEAYNAEYIVDTIEFEASLELMLFDSNY